jgi:ferritin-like metal-binding protein YciE
MEGEKTMKIESVKDLYLTELQEARSFEEQIAAELGDLARKASDPGLKAFLQDDAPEAQHHRDKVAELIEAHGARPSEHDDQTMRSILAGAADWADQIDDPSLRDAALIASAQRVQHYEICVYGTLATWAKQLGLDDLNTLLRILDEEKEADARLSELAKKSVNAEAAAA